jgi:hypothetical protein
MRSGTMLLREALDSLSDDERREFNIKATQEIFAIDERLQNAHGGSSGSGQHLLLSDPLDNLPGAMTRLRADDRPRTLRCVDDLITEFTGIVARMIKDRLRDIKGDTRKVVKFGDKRIKVIRPGRPATAVGVYEKDPNSGAVVRIDVRAKPENHDNSLSIVDIDLPAKEHKERFLELLIKELELRKPAWADRFAKIIRLCLDWPESWHDLIVVNAEGRLSFKVQRIAAILQEDPQDISNALRHRDTLAEELGDPEFEKLKKAAAAEPGE